MVIFTIGHSTRSIKDFIDILKNYKIKHLIDVRTVPKSRFVPQFNKEVLNKSMKDTKINYTHLELLGGLRSVKKDSINQGWRNKSFRGYADYMQTSDFEKGIEQLLDFANRKQVVIMCAEAVPWRCHRSLIGDALIARGIKVVDIIDKNHSKDETLTSFAKIEQNKITYPAEPDEN